MALINQKAFERFLYGRRNQYKWRPGSRLPMNVYYRSWKKILPVTVIGAFLLGLTALALLANSAQTEPKAGAFIGVALGLALLLAACVELVSPRKIKLTTDRVWFQQQGLSSRAFNEGLHHYSLRWETKTFRFHHLPHSTTGWLIKKTFPRYVNRYLITLHHNHNPEKNVVIYSSGCSEDRDKAMNHFRELIYPLAEQGQKVVP